MADTLFTIIIIAVCLAFLCFRAIKNFKGQGGSCGCSCSGGCTTTPNKKQGKNPEQTIPSFQRTIHPPNNKEGNK